MKKALFIIAAVAMVFSLNSCNKQNSTYGGTYVGTYQFFKQNSSTVDSVRNDKKLPVLQLTDNSVSVFDVIPLSKASEGIYETSEEGTSFLTTILSTFGVGAGVNESIKAVKLRADFTVSQHLTFTMAYEVSLLQGLANTEIRILQFDGDKQAK